ncbi:MAG: hypothetical protein AAFN27_07960 [Pseudomonadota bacterium]
MRWLAGIVCLALAGCAPELPETGTPTPYDGRWTGKASPAGAGCYAFTIVVDVRFGKLVGEIRDGSKLGDVWGDIGPDGKLNGKIGVAGVRGARADVQLDAETGKGIGSYSSNPCSGTLEMVRAG